VQWYEDGIYYRYASAVNNSESVINNPKSTVRGITLINLTKIYRDPLTNKVKFVVLM